MDKRLLMLGAAALLFLPIWKGKGAIPSPTVGNGLSPEGYTPQQEYVATFAPTSAPSLPLLENSTKLAFGMSYDDFTKAAFNSAYAEANAMLAYNSQAQILNGSPLNYAYTKAAQAGQEWNAEIERLKMVARREMLDLTDTVSSSGSWSQ